MTGQASGPPVSGPALALLRAARYLAAPCPGFLTPGLDELFASLQVALGAALHHAQGGTDLHLLLLPRRRERPPPGPLVVQ